MLRRLTLRSDFLHVYHLLAQQVGWVKGSAFDNAILKDLLPKATVVIHTLGILLESNYKSSVSGLASGLVKGLAENWSSSASRGNPLATSKNRPSSTAPQASSGLYERINRDSAINVMQAYIASRSTSTTGTPFQTDNPFVYVSAADVFKPFVPERYITTKREAESRIRELCDQNSLAQTDDTQSIKPDFRPIFARPGRARIDYEQVLH